MPLRPLNIRHAEAAMGWLELGNTSEAYDELEKISMADKMHPDVLDIRCQLYAKDKDWDACRLIAVYLTETTPEQLTGWIHLAHATRWATGGGEEPARQVLFSAVDRFPNHPIFPYLLARYACEHRNFQEAWQWLEKTFANDTSKVFKLKAIEDPELKELWTTISEI